MPWTDQQEHIFDFVKKSKSSAYVDAVAGSGKTSTIVESLSHLPFSATDVLFLAFNKAIADELKSKIPSGIEARTFNSLGHSAVNQAVSGKVELDKQKMWGFWNKNAPDDLKPHAAIVLSLISAAKSAGLGVIHPNTQDNVSTLIEAYDIDIEPEIERQATQLVSRAIDWSLRTPNPIDFDDQLLHPLSHSYALPKYDMIFVDEAQDLSPLQHEFLTHLLKDTSRLIAVGDKHQAIYGFRGASAHSIDLLSSRFSLEPLPMHTSFRCPQNVVLEAQCYVPHIQHFSGAIEGYVGDLDGLPEISTFGANDRILCRVNAPIMRLGMSFLRRQLPVHVEGNFGPALIKFVKSFAADDIDSFHEQLEEWKDRQITDAMEKDRWAKIDHINDKYESILAISESARDPNDVVTRLEKLFAPDNGPTISTIHKAKGKEAERVFLIRPDLCPLPNITGGWKLDQEYNLLYVAITRTLYDFFYIQDENI